MKIPINLDEATGRTFMKEMKGWESLKHPNIVEMYNMNILPVPFFEIEYVENKNLEVLIKPVEIEQAIKIVFDIAEGLKYAHALGVIHRDIKALNILLTKDMVPKITDWGLSKIVAESKTSTTKGYSPLYTSPEQLSPKRFGKTDAKTDIYQLGIIFFELVTGKLPFNGESLDEIFYAIINDDPIPPSDLNPKAKEIEHIILKCMSKNQGNRYLNAIELQQDLAKYLKQEYLKALNKPTVKDDITISRLFCVDLVLLNAKTSNTKEALKYAEYMKNYTKGKASDDLKGIVKQLEYLIERKQPIEDEFMVKIEVVMHRLKLRR